MIFVTPNPAIDRTMLVARLQVGEIQRTAGVLIAAGGKGVNAARAAHTLGGTPLCMGLAGGVSGQLFVSLVEREGMQAFWSPITGETRTCIILMPADGDGPTVINEPGPLVSPDEWSALFASLEQQAAPGRLVCFSGSLPPGLPPDVMGDAAMNLTRLGCRVWVDSSGPALEAAIAACPEGIKINAHEAGSVRQREIDSIEAAAAAGRALNAQGIGSVVITLGGRGAVLCAPDSCWHAAPLPVRATSSVGSGDAFFGAFILALEQGFALPSALQRGAAAGAANTLQPGAAVFTATQFEELLENTTLARLDL